MAIKNRPLIWCLHGNLQLPCAWKPFAGAFTYSPHRDSHVEPKIGLKLEDLWEAKGDGYAAWTKNFCDQVHRFGQGQPQFLMGYSLGGRLALHALIGNPGLWLGVIVISADTGFTDDEKRRTQLLKDLEWGRRFQCEPWNDLIEEWDAQEVFGGRPCTIARREKDFSRQRVGELFNTFSKGRQENLLPVLSKGQFPPILFIAGEDDTYYHSVGRRLSQGCDNSALAIIPEATHRVPWENPDEFIRVVQRFIDRVIIMPN